MATKEELEAQNAALRDLLAAVRALADAPSPADCYDPAFTMECWKRLDEIAIFADLRSVSVHATFTRRTETLREMATQPPRYKTKDVSVREPNPRCCETCAATEDLERTVWRSMADGSEHARYFCIDRRACNDRRFPDMAALLDREPRVGAPAPAAETAATGAVEVAPDCECSHKRGAHNLSRGKCAAGGCGCTRYRTGAAPSSPVTPAVVAGTVERERVAVTG